MAEKRLSSITELSESEKKVRKPRKTVKKAKTSNASAKTSPKKPHSAATRRVKETTPWTTANVILLALVAAIIIFNQATLGLMDNNTNMGGGTTRVSSGSSTATLGAVDLSQITSTAQAVAAVFPIDEIATAQDAINIMIPTGTPEYSDAFGGISFDDPVGSLTTLAQMYAPLKAKIQSEDPETFQRFVDLAIMPVGISCEFCCGVGPVGIDNKGNSRCGCKHNPAVLSIALGLMATTDYSDAEVLQEVLKWKSLFFPQNMVDIAIKAADGDIAAGQLPKMVGGC